MKRQQNEQLATAFYCRTAHTNHDGIELQKQSLIRFAKEKGIYPFTFYIDDGFSGLNFDRPAFQEMCEAIETGRITAVAVTEISRIGRNIFDVLHFIEDMLPDKGVTFHTVEG